jgi:hypothetical protein
MDDIAVVARMLEIARKYSLEAEVVAAFGAYRASGDPVEVAAQCALFDWDL